MTDNTEPTIEDRLKGIMKLINDYASGWDVGCPEPSEGDIKQAIKSLISDQVAKARLDERTQAQQYLHGLTITPESQHLFDVLSRNNHNRIATLKGVKNNGHSNSS